MTYDEALSYISTISARGSKPGLERITELMNGLGNVQENLKFVHIAGTNGKGSTSVMLSSVLQQAGYRTGLFISPYIMRFNERMQINGEPIADERLAEIIEQVKAVADTMEDGATEFELVTAAAFLWFSQENCDIVVLETGLGGRLDATNIISTNECAVITNIGLDHVDYLGDTLAKIAYEKACIMKPERPVVCYASEPEALDVLKDYAKEHGNPIRIAKFEAIEGIFAGFSGQRFRYGNSAVLEMSMLGGHQLRNAAVVLETVKTLRGLGWDISTEALKKGFKEAHWPARFELIHRDPLVFADGAHNLQGVEVLCQAIRDYLPGERIVCVTGVLADKDWKHMMDLLKDVADDFITVTPNSPRALNNITLARYLSDSEHWVSLAENVGQGMHAALNRAKDTGSVVVACGSLYMCGEIRSYFGRNA